MFQWIETHAPQSPSGVVTKQMRDEAIYSRTYINVAFGVAFEDLPGSPQVLEEIVPAGFASIGVEPDCETIRFASVRRRKAGKQTQSTGSTVVDIITSRRCTN